MCVKVIKAFHTFHATTNAFRDFTLTSKTHTHFSRNESRTLIYEQMEIESNIEFLDIVSVANLSILLLD